MKAFIALFLGLFLTMPALAAGGFQKEKFQKTFYIAYGGAATNSGMNPASPKPFTDGDLWAIPAQTVIERVYAIVDTAVTGTTDFDIGDDDDSDGFLDGSLSLTIGTVGMYGWNSKVAGAYLRVQTAGATDAADIYVVPNAKYYSAAGKSLKLDGTGTATAGKVRIIVEGFYVGDRNQ
jgi:hypothetical protein